MDDLFSVPLGYVDPDQGSDDEPSISPIPPEAYDHRGKWLALRRGHVAAVHDSQRDLYEDPIIRESDVVIFYAPTSHVFAR